MYSTRKNTIQKSLAESDEEFGDFSRESDEEWQPDTVKSTN